jgi:hypothetical protein
MKGKKKKKANTDTIDTMISYGRKLEASAKYNEADALMKIALQLINDHSNNTK